MGVVTVFCGMGLGVAGLREVAAPYVAPGPSGVAVRTRLKHLTGEDESVLCLVGDLLGALASRDLKARCASGLKHDSGQWAERKRVLTGESSSPWAGSVTKATRDQWALARRGLLAHIHSLQAGVDMLRHRLSLPLGEKGTKRAPGGYRGRQEWFAKSRRLHVLEDRLRAARADWQAGIVHVVRGGKRLLNTRHHLQAAQLTETEWRARWQAGRRFLQADGESGKRHGNETIRVTPDGEVSLKLPAPLAHLANAPHGRYVLAVRVLFAHRGEQWADRVAAHRAVAYRIHQDVGRGRWYLTASWTLSPARTMPLEAARENGLVGVDTNADHLAAWRLDRHGNPTGEPLRFGYDLTGTADHRDAQVRHALIRLLHWAARHGLAIAVEDLDFQREKTREKHGRRKSFRNLISGMPVSRLRSRLVSMAAQLGIPVIVVDPAYTSRWAPSTGRNPSPARSGGPLATTRQPWRSEGAPWDTRSGVGRHRPHTTRAIVRGIGPSRPDRTARGVRETAPVSPDHGHDPCRPDMERTRSTRTPNTVRGVRLSTSPDNRAHPHSVSRNGSLC